MTRFTAAISLVALCALATPSSCWGQAVERPASEPDTAPAAVNVAIDPCTPNAPGAVLGDGVTTGPATGTLIIAGGGRLSREVVDLFIERAGGKDAGIVYVPTASGGDLSGNPDDSYGVVRLLKGRGCTDVTVLHTRDPEVANTEAFVEPIERAGGVWFSGGRQWRFTDAYLGTAACGAFHRVLERGGVIAGSSAGATIQGSYLVRGSPKGNTIMMAKGHEQGFGFLENAAIDQHLFKRGRERDIIPVIERFPHLLGIGIDESAAIAVEDGRLWVLGGREGGDTGPKVAIYDHAVMTVDEPYQVLRLGDGYDLHARRAIPGG
jgi:cyanophycinase